MKSSAASGWRPIVIIAFAAVAGVVMYTRAERAAEGSPDAARIIAMQRELPRQQFHDMPVVDLSDESFLRSTLAVAINTHTFEMVPGDATVAPGDDHTALANELTRFLYLRYVQQNAQAYLAWRSVPGVGWVDRQRLASTWFVAKDFEAATGRPWNDDVSVPAAFATLFDEAFTRHTPRRRFVGICADGVRVARAVQRGGDSEYPYLSGGRQDADVHDDLWYGARGATMRPWFAFKARRLQSLQRGGSVPVAVIGLPMVNGAGERVPVLTEWFFDTSSSRWVMEAMYINNYKGSDDFGTLNF